MLLTQTLTGHASRDPSSSKLLAFLFIFRAFDMEQFLLHAIGDYITQTNKMAMLKTESWFWAVVHGTIYALPFLLIGSMSAVFVIWATHIVIDRLRIARFVVYAKNWITEPSLAWINCSKTGYPDDTPQWLAVWLLIIADNVMHLCINYAALRWIG